MLSFRTARIADAENISNLVNSAYRGDSSRQGWTTEADLLGGQRTDPGKVQEIIEAPLSLIELAYDSEAPEEILGCVYLNQEGNSILYFGMLTVRPQLQAKGLGKKLLVHIEEIAKNLGRTQMRMTVIQSRIELIAFYERRGYRPTGKTEPFPAADPRFGILKTQNIEFLEYTKDLSPGV